MSAVSELYPWLEPAWRTLSMPLESGRVPQALMLHGPGGVGKARLAEVFAQRLLCRNAAGLACGECAGCRLFQAGTHPDFIRVEPPEPGKSIGVDAIRHLIADLALKPQYGGYRIVVLAPAHQMNLNAANALLKTLEEPAERTVMLLLTDTPSGLPATILSRCQRLAVPLPAPDAARRWLTGRTAADAGMLLAAARGAPLRALALAESDVLERRGAFFSEWEDLLSGRAEPVAAAEHRLADFGEECLEWMLSWTADLIRLRSAAGAGPLYNPDLNGRLQSLAAGLNLKGLFDLWSLGLRARQALHGQINRQLLLEELFIHCGRLGRRRNPDG